MPGMAETLSGPQARPGQGTRRRRLPGLHRPGTCWRQRAGNLDHVLRVGVIPWLCWLPPRLLWSHVLMPGASAGTTGERGACCTRRADPPPGTVGREAGTELGQPEGRRCGGGPVPGCLCIGHFLRLEGSWTAYTRQLTANNSKPWGSYCFTYHCPPHSTLSPFPPTGF